MTHAILNAIDSGAYDTVIVAVLVVACAALLVRLIERGSP